MTAALTAVQFGRQVLRGLFSRQVSLRASCFWQAYSFANWRHAIVAVIGAAIAAALAAQAGAPGAAINSGFVGFNAVLAALAAYNLIAADLRLVVLASVLSTWLASYVYRGAPVPVLASGFVLAIWLMLFLGWLNPQYARIQPGPEAD